MQMRRCFRERSGVIFGKGVEMGNVRLNLDLIPQGRENWKVGFDKVLKDLDVCEKSQYTVLTRIREFTRAVSLIWNFG